MLSKNEVKYIQSLYHKKQRNVDNLFIVEGVKLVDEILNSKYAIQKIYATKDWIEKNPTVEAVEIETIDLEKISQLQTPNQVVAIVSMLEQSISKNYLSQLNIVLDGIQDPGNFGTIIRIADWFGIENIICSNDCVELYNPKVIQSTMGSFTRVNIIYDDIEKILQSTKLNIYGALLDGEDIKSIEKPKSGFLVIGNEGNGIREHILPLITNKISIKKYGGAESLNAAVATGILVALIK